MLGSTSHQDSSKSTPHSNKLGSYNSLSHGGSARTELDDAARKEGERLAEERIRMDDITLELARSCEQTTRATAAQSADTVAQALESYLSLEQASDVPMLPQRLQAASLRVELPSLATEFKPWVLPAGHPDADGMAGERRLYSYFRDLVLFVMKCLKALHSGDDIREHYRLLLPYEKGGDSRAKDSTQGFKVDQILVLQPWCHEVGQGVNKWRYADILAVVEAKTPDRASSISKANAPPSGSGMSELTDKANPSPPKLRDAQGQLICYSRHIYESQPNRAIFWGLTICGSLVRVYNSGPDFVLSSADLDVRSSDGRKQFVEWLVNMSLGEDDRRGFDTAVQLVDDGVGGKCWKFYVPMVDSDGNSTNETKLYYSRCPTFAAGTSFGRNTRGFPATEDISNIDEPNVYIKTAWQHMEPESDLKRPSELKCLLKLAKMLDEHPKSSIHTPHLKAGGVMAVRRSDGTSMPMTTTNYYGKAVLKRLAGANEDEFDQIGQEAGSALFTTPRGRHVFVTSPYCDPLNTATSVHELIIVLYHAMRTHSWALETCNLLHRDISANNIMIKRGKAENGNLLIHGILIDYDCAIHPGVERVARPERTGTKPFMSVLNLEAHPDERTELDDWESMFYVLCFLATFGINHADREILTKAREPGLKIRLKIMEWHANRGMADIADDKRSHLDSLKSFIGDIAGRFPAPAQGSELPDYRPLRNLAIDLYKAMFQNEEVGEECWGARKQDDFIGPSVVAAPAADDEDSDEYGDIPQKSIKGLTIDPSSPTNEPVETTPNDPFVSRAVFANRAVIIKSLQRTLKSHAKQARASFL